MNNHLLVIRWHYFTIISSQPIKAIRERDTYHSRDHSEDEEPFWQLDEEIGEGRFFGEQATIRLKAHISDERYHHANELDELMPLHTKSGTPVYVLAKPYIL